MSMRPTPQRTAVTSLLDRSGDFRSAQDIFNALRAEGLSIGLATVYRTLQGLSAAGDVDVLVREDGETVYRRCTTGHHHHLVCRACGRTVEVSGPAVEAWADAVAAEHGFSQIDHTLELSGLCADCSS